MTLDQVPAGAHVFVDSNVLVYHFQRCRAGGVSLAVRTQPAAALIRWMVLQTVLFCEGGGNAANDLAVQSPGI